VLPWLTLLVSQPPSVLQAVTFRWYLIIVAIRGGAQFGMSD
jgi:hypothetical protein